MWEANNVELYTRSQQTASLPWNFLVLRILDFVCSKIWKDVGKNLSSLHMNPSTIAAYFQQVILSDQAPQTFQAQECAFAFAGKRKHIPTPADRSAPLLKACIWQVLWKLLRLSKASRSSLQSSKPTSVTGPKLVLESGRGPLGESTRCIFIRRALMAEKGPAKYG